MLNPSPDNIDTFDNNVFLHDLQELDQIVILYKEHEREATTIDSEIYCIWRIWKISSQEVEFQILPFE